MFRSTPSSTPMLRGIQKPTEHRLRVMAAMALGSSLVAITVASGFTTTQAASATMAQNGFENVVDGSSDDDKPIVGLFADLWFAGDRSEGWRWFIRPWTPKQPTPIAPATVTTALSTTTTLHVDPMPPTLPTTTSTTSTTRPRGQRSTDDVIDPDDPSVLFFSNNDSCRDIENSQRHPDWVEGQSNSGLNEDGTPTYGYAYNTGDSTAGEVSWGFVESSIALSGECVLSMGVNDLYETKRAIRIFRRYDQNGRNLPSEAYYSVWFHFPHEVSFDSRATIDGSTVYGFWNVFQIKNKVAGNSLATFSINAGKVTGEDFMSFHIWNKADCGAVEECSAANGIDQDNPIAIPTGRWVHVEMYLRASTGEDGRLTLWQDGQEIIDYSGVTERNGSIRRNWSVNNYGRLHRPASHKLYVDDALIRTRPIHPELFD